MVKSYNRIHTQDEAKAAIKQWLAQGLSRPQMAARLKRAGFKSDKTGRAVSHMAVTAWIRQMREDGELGQDNGEAPSPTPPAPTTPSISSCVRAVRRILTSDLPAEDRIAIATDLLPE